MNAKRPLCIILFLMVLFLFPGHPFAGTPREIELDDGSMIHGEIISFRNGTYKIKTQSLGTVEIEESKILSIRSKAACKNCKKTPPSMMEGSAASQIKSLKKTMMNDEGIMTMIHSLQADPDFIRIMHDPEIMKALMTGNIDFLMSNPKFLELIDNQTVQDIGKQISEKKAPPQ